MVRLISKYNFKFLMSTGIMAFALPLSAQRLSIGIEAGPAFGEHCVASTDGVMKGFWQSKDIHYRGGVPVELSFLSPLKISSGLFYSSKGSWNTRTLLGIEVGAGFGWHGVASQRQYEIKQYNTTDTRFRGGISLEYPLLPWLSISSGLFYTLKGDTEYPRTNLPREGGMLDYETLEFPVLANYQKISGSGNRFFAGVGPFMGYGIRGTVRKRNISTERRSSEPVRWGNDLGDHIQRIQYGVQLQTGWIHRSGLMCRLIVQTGANAAPQRNKSEKVGITKVHNMLYAAVTAGYLFRYKQHKQ